MISNDKEERPAIDQQSISKNTNPEPEQELLNTRRKALGKILVAGGVIAGAHLIPSKWASPVVNSIIVPAHAQTSGPVTTPAPGTPAPTTPAPTTTPTPTTTPRPTTTRRPDDDNHGIPRGDPPGNQSDGQGAS